MAGNSAGVKWYYFMELINQEYVHIHMISINVWIVRPYISLFTSINYNLFNLLLYLNLSVYFGSGY